MNNTLRIFLAGIVAFGLFSCNKTLDVVPTNQVNANESIKTPADAQIMINGIVRSMSNADYYGRRFILYGDVKGGDMTVPSQGRGDDALYTFNHSATSNSYSGYWSQIYFSLLQVNNLLENIARLEATGAAGYNSYKGQALTLRAIMYFDMVRLYGKSYDLDKNAFGVPNVTTPLKSTAQPLRNTVSENYNQILSDLKAGAPLLAKTKSNGFVNYYGNLAMQARVYLYMKDNANALKAAEEIITSNVYTLYSNAAWVDSWKAQYGSESIFEIGVYPLEGDLGAASIGAYHRRKGDGGSTILGWFVASDYFLTRLNEDAADVRWGVMKEDEISTTANPRKGSLYKYSGNISLAGDGKATPTAVNLKLIRLSEIYLIAAEAVLPTDATKAATYLNAIRKRAPNLAPATAATVTVDMILDERSKELYGEGQRFFDMIRLNKSITFNDEIIGISVATRPKTIDRTFYKTLLPISQAEINANPGILAQQNPQY
ncbi:RagB/SusD family nutrient uptake outer membrane protein [Paraflavitalea sp. CAU 1676]|uniref:RagB/SusD family nutrient uptake outer membrane protein n=1 Tax=Paraflavitalea sp. CAU 1676 TaxID=3032598 RepID=UPI0023DBE8FF|nr:RagB/SusD family nutrient uptake outer membrane protein [Paraflavitalea sp. CAU 1676]MDF2187185.1 RagB/SusD family nutrient uptake outer membrane protein [Paraflavitalea sp. CAU 1676]